MFVRVVGGALAAQLAADGQTVARRARHLRSEEWPQKAQDAQNLNPSDRHLLSAILEPCEPLVANS